MSRILIDIEQSFAQLGYQKVVTNGKYLRFVNITPEHIQVYLPHVMKRRGGVRVGGSVASVDSPSDAHIDIAKETDPVNIASQYVRLENYPDTILLGSFVSGKEYSVNDFVARIDNIIKSIK